MNFLRFRVIILSLVSFLATAAYAVEQLPEKEEDIPVEYIPTLDNSISVGMRRFSGRSKVKFGNLGVINNSAIHSGDNHYYSNGAVSSDAITNYELGTDGALNSTTGTAFFNYNSVVNGATTINAQSVRTAVGTTGQSIVTVYSTLYDYATNTADDGSLTYSINYSTDGLPLNQKDGSGNDLYASTSKFLAYKDGQTRNWRVENASQLNTTDHTVSMTTYGASSRGATMEAEGAPSSGVELALEHRLRHFGKLEVGFSGSISLDQINMKASGLVVSNRLETTDVYKMVEVGALYTTAGSDPITQPSGVDLPLTQLGGTTVLNQYVDGTTTPATSNSTGDTSGGTPLYLNYTAGSTIVNGTVLIYGNWQIKGAYYNVKLGPTFRYRFNDRWAVSGGLGLSTCYVGTVFKAEENIIDIDTASALLSKEENTTHKFVPGYYGNMNLEYWVSERTGFYFGLDYQKQGSYSQTPLSGRTAKIDLGTSSGWRMGIVTRF